MSYETIYLTSGEPITVDADMYPVLSRFAWRREGDGEVQVKFETDNRRYRIRLHVFVLALERAMHGEFVTAMHLDGDRSNFTRDNLRSLNRSEASRSNKKADTYGGKKTSSKYKGVSWNKKSGQWIVKGRLNRRPVTIGYFDDEVAAAEAYDEFARKHYGPSRRVNFPEGYEQGALLENQCIGL